MSARILLVISALAFSISATEAIASNQAVTKQSAKQANNHTSKSAVSKRATLKRRSSAGHHTTSTLIPPPPAFQPSILPESYYYRGRTVATQTEEDDDSSTDEIAAKPQNKLSKYFYSREGDVPQTNRYNTRSGVTNWAALR